jgi:hypothetical protein
LDRLFDQEGRAIRPRAPCVLNAIGDRVSGAAAQ